jgi:hypothetical protein
MSVLRKWTGWILGVGGILVLAGAGATAQMSIFSSALESPLSGAFSDALPILVLKDVGSYQPGAPDGKLDLITAEQSAGVATVWFGNGDGTFPNSNAGTVVGGTPTALALGDFDGDHVPDLAVTDTSGSVVLLHGNGDGTFSQMGSAVPVGASPVALAAVDVNHDNKLDLVVVNSSESTGGVTVLLGDGHGRFIGHCSLSTSTQCFTKGDCLGSETCTLGKSLDLPPGGSAIAFGDFGNGNEDLAIANGNTNSVFIFQGDGYGNFSVPQEVHEGPNGRQPVAIAVGDLNKDKRLDLVVANQATDNIGVLLGQPDGTFKLHDLFGSGTENSSPNGVALLDANGDGKLDVAVSNYYSFDVSVLLGDGAGNFGAPRAFVTDQEPLAVAAGDLNGDGIPDLVALNRDNTLPDAVALLGQGDGTFKGVEDVIVDPSPDGVIAGDVDNDGLADLIAAHSTGTLLVRRAQPSGGFAAPITLQAAGDAVAIGEGDFNADGRLDIVALNKSTSNVSMFLGQKNGFSSIANYPVAGGVALTVGDWDHNGRADLAVASQGAGSSGTINIFLSKPDGSLQLPPTTIPLSANPSAIDWGDFNKDGNLDLAVVSAFGVCSVTTSQACNTDTDCPKQHEVCYHESKLTISLGNGNGTFQPGIDITIAGAGGDARKLAVADFDGDGFDDIAVLLAPPDNKLVVLYGSGGVSFTAGPLFPGFAGNNVWDLAARDITGDLLPDLLVSVQGVGVNAVFAFASRGVSRGFDAVASVPVSRSPTSITAADFDGDGRYDAATADSNVAGSVSVLTNIGATPIIRGDANGDGKATAADLLAVARKLRDGAATRVEQAGKGSYHVKPGADANGDGLITAQDAQALTHRLFPRI